MTLHRLRLVTLTFVLFATGGCSWLPFRHHAPTPPPPPPVAVADTTKKAAPVDTTAAKPDTEPESKKTTARPHNGNHTATSDTVATTPQPVAPVETMSADERQRSLANTVADTTAASQALRKCGGRALQADQSATAEAVRSLMAQTRAAIATGELWRAESLARKAHQLASSLSCP